MIEGKFGPYGRPKSFVYAVHVSKLFNMIVVVVFSDEGTLRGQDGMYTGI